MTQVNRTRWPVQSTKKGSELNQHTNTVGPSRNVSTSNMTRMNLNPRTIKGQVERQDQDLPNVKFPNLRPAPLIPNQRIRGRTTLTIMIYRDPGNSNHKTDVRPT